MKNKTQKKKSDKNVSDTEEVKTTQAEPEKEEAAAPEAEAAEKADAKKESGDKEALKNDSGYKTGKLIYDAGIIIMAAMLLLNAARFLLHIELFIGGEFRSSLIYFFYLIPCAVMIVGLLITGKASRKYNVKGGDGLGIGMIICIAALISALGVVETVKPSYHVYTTKDISLRDGQELCAVEYIQIGLFDNPAVNRPGKYNVDVYKTEGIFAKRLVTGTVFYSKYEILAGEGEKDYMLDIESSVGGETIPFTY